MADIRPIDANALFDALYDNEFQTFCPLDEVSDVIAAAPTIDYAPVWHGEWISVKDRLPPDKGKSILVVDGHGHVRILAFWNKDDAEWKWLDQNGHFKHFNDVTHWMQLPEPPKEH